MASEDNTHISRTFTSQELHGLADRMFSRGISALSTLNAIRLDMVTCSGCLRRLTTDNPGGVDVDIGKDVP
jgi:hypothetical protein